MIDVELATVVTPTHLYLFTFKPLFYRKRMILFFKDPLGKMAEITVASGVRER